VDQKAGLHRRGQEQRKVSKGVLAPDRKSPFLRTRKKAGFSTATKRNSPDPGRILQAEHNHRKKNMSAVRRRADRIRFLTLGAVLPWHTKKKGASWDNWNHRVKAHMTIPQRIVAAMNQSNESWKERIE